jgi:hypothetical protein
MSILDPKWKYTHSTATDIRKTFARVKRQLAGQAEPKAAKHDARRPTNPNGQYQRTPNAA